MSTSQEKKAAMAAALAQIEKSYGEGSIMKMSSETTLNIDRFPSGALSLDLALGGGYPKGRIIEIYGPESSGKTTLTLHAIAEIQKQGGVAAFIDAEHALDPSYAKKIGVNIDDLYVSQPDNGEQALEITETLVRSGAVDLIIVDSVAALTPKAEIEGMMGDQHMGLQARLMSQALRKLTSIIGKTKCTVVFINQIRMKIGVMFGNPETTTGGNALKFYSSIRVEVRRKTKIESGTGDNKEVQGNQVQIKIVKNKVAPPFKEALFDIMYNEGISQYGDILDTAVRYDVVKKAGAFYSYEGTKLGQGREASKEFLKNNPNVLEAITSAVHTTLAV